MNGFWGRFCRFRVRLRGLGAQARLSRKAALCRSLQLRGSQALPRVRQLRVSGSRGGAAERREWGPMGGGGRGHVGSRGAGFWGHLGSIWDHLGVILGVIWSDFGVIWG